MDWKTSNDATELRTFAQQIGAEFHPQSGVKKLQTAIALKLGEVSDMPEPAMTEEQKLRMNKATNEIEFGSMQAKLRAQPRVVVMIASTDNDHRPVPAGFNGVTFIIERDKEKIIPLPVAQVIQDAREKRFRWDPKQNANVARDVPCYPISILREATKEDLAEEKRQAREAAGIGEKIQ